MFLPCTSSRSSKQTITNPIRKILAIFRMKFSSPLLFLSALSSTTFAAPSPHSNDEPAPHSIQVLYSYYHGYMIWCACFGPFGVSVDPCNPEAGGFQELGDGVEDTQRNAAMQNMANPPNLAADVKWIVPNDIMLQSIDEGT